MKTDEENVMERLERLEKQLHWWKVLVIWGGFGVAALAGLAFAMSFSKMTPSPSTAATTKGRIVLADEVAGRRFVVIDEHQKPQADFGFFGDSPRLALYDEKADASIQLNFGGGPLPGIRDLSGGTPAHVRTQSAVPGVYVQGKDKRGSLEAAALRLTSDVGFSAHLSAEFGASLSLIDDSEYNQALSETMKSGKLDFEKLSAIRAGASLYAGLDKNSPPNVSLFGQAWKDASLAQDQSYRFAFAYSLGRKRPPASNVGN